MTIRILVTGASGFVGRHTLAPLLRAGCEVHAVRSPRSAMPSSAIPGLRWRRADLTDGAAIRALVGSIRPTHVLHCAWEVSHGRFWTAPENLAWVGASLTLARAAADAGCRRFVGIGSAAEYAWSDGASSPRREDDPLGSDTLYGEAKASTFRLLRRAFDGQPPSFAWARLFHLFGPGEPAARLAPSIAAAIARGEPARLRSGTLVRDLMAAQDAGAALARLLVSPVEGAVNVASGQSVTLETFAREIAAMLGRPDLLDVQAVPPSPAEIPSMTADIARLRTEVGHEPARRSEGLSVFLQSFQYGEATSPVST